MAWYGMDFFCEGEAFDRYPLLDLTDWLIDLWAFAFLPENKKLDEFLFIDCFLNSFRVIREDADGLIVSGAILGLIVNVRMLALL